MKRTLRYLAISLSLFAPFLALRAYAGVDGTYALDVESLKEAASQMPEFQNMPEEQRDQALTMFDGMKITMTLKDGEFIGHAEAMGQVHEGKGTYLIDGDVITITTTEEDGQPKAEKEVQKAKLEGDRILIQEEGMPFAVSLVKVE